MSERPYTPEGLAERWQCKTDHVRKMLQAGELHGFKIGAKLWRIPAAEVERIECRTIDSASSEEDGSLSGTARTEADIAGALKQRLRVMHEQNLESSRANVTDLSSRNRR